MAKDKKYERQNDELLRMREKLTSLNNENSALKAALVDKEKTITDLEEDRDKLLQQWNERVNELSEAIESASEAEMIYRKAYDTAIALQKKYKVEMEKRMKLLKQATNRKAV